MTDDVLESQWDAFKNKKPFTVILSYQDLGMQSPTFSEFKVLAASPKQAVFFAKHEAYVEGLNTDDDLNKENFEVVAVFKYHLENLKEE